MIAGIGASVGGYHAESGITLILGEPTADQRHCLTAAAAANDAAVAALRPGTPCRAVNDAALAELRAAGLGDAIRHRIGHAMGVQGHEGPWLAPGDDTPVAVGMVFSNEPGIYRPGIDGYRTINTMIVTETGVEVPSTFQARHPLDARVVAL
jgi:Xaa-Pro aminopeptidase